MHAMKGALLIILSLMWLAPDLQSVQKPLKAGEDGQGPWWMKQTAIKRDGTMASLKTKPWWGKAQKLKVSESFIVDAAGEAKNRMLVRRERFKIRSGKEIEAIVWVIDDDGDGSVLKGGDKHDDCYVADYGCDGVVDRMVDYVEGDGDKAPDEMDIRYFIDGKLNYCWLGQDIDRDGKMWNVVGYEYQGDSYFESDPYGDNIFYMNKLNTDKGIWSPISECPFAFYDVDKNGYSQVVVRVSAVPLGYNPSQDPDYANAAFNRKWGKEMEKMGVINVRYSFDVDNLSGKDFPLHYEAGFNLVGAAPYDYPGMNHFNSNRRPPQETVVIPWKDMRTVADNYNARETGFSWHENNDETTAIGFAEHKKENYRWEGIFWLWERRFMENTGGPCQKWNVRREWSSKPTNRRELYYSEVDRRVHLFGAEEGWVEIGNFSGLGRIGEIRMLDTDKNGYFDRWEVYLAGKEEPVRVTTVRDERARRVNFDKDCLYRPYAREVLPEAMAANEKLMKAMTAVLPFELPEGLKKAMTSSGPDNFRRYAQDVARELQYQSLRSRLMKQSDGVLADLATGERNDRTHGDLPRIIRERKGDIESTPNSHTAWKLTRALMDLDQAYGQGDYGRACDLLDDIGQAKAFK